MTREQREEIRRLRDCGEGYKHIAAMLGLSVNTVKSFCQRENAKQQRCALLTQIIAIPVCHRKM